MTFFFFAPKPLNALSPAPIPATSQGLCGMGGPGGAPTAPRGDLEGPGQGAVVWGEGCLWQQARSPR